MKGMLYRLFFGIALGASSIACAQSPAPTIAAHSTRRSQGFLDYALGKINPSDKDYGSSAAETRGDMVAYTIQSLYFWSNGVSLLLLTATSTALILVLRTQDKREIIAATLIAQLWNGRVVDRQEIARRTEMHNALVEARNAALTPRVSTSLVDELSATTVAAPSAAKPSVKSGVQKRAGVSDSPSSIGEIGNQDLMESGQNHIVLTSQVQALRNSERNLRARLNQVSQDLERERQRNHTLKGA